LESLVIRPILDGDEVSQYSFRWAEDPIRDLKNAHFQVNDIGGREVSKQEVVEAIDSRDPYVVVHYDHGDEDAWIGNKTEPIMTSADAHLLSGRVVYTMNCLSAKTLGVNAWKAGAKAYVGYVQEFAFTLDGELLFREAVGYGLSVYLSGITDWSQIKRRMVDKFNEMMAAATDPWTGMWLRHDRDALRIYNGETPETTCFFRKIALLLLGKRYGWLVGRGQIVGFAVFFFSFGLAVHDFAHSLWALGGLKEILGLHGGWIGFGGMLLAFLACGSQYLRKLRRT